MHDVVEVSVIKNKCFEVAINLNPCVDGMIAVAFVSLKLVISYSRLVDEDYTLRWLPLFPPSPPLDYCDEQYFVKGSIRLFVFNYLSCVLKQLYIASHQCTPLKEASHCLLYSF